MHPQIRRYTTLALMCLLTFALACNLGDETDKANKLIEEGNAAITEGDKIFNEANNKLTALDANADKDKATAEAQQVMDDFDKTAAKAREAAKKFDEASKLKVDDKFKEYLTLKSKEFTKKAEQVEAAKDLPKAMLDSSDAAAMNAKVAEINARIEKLDKEWKDLAAQADKVREDNKDKFQK
ncbi:MAG: hypothetical protein QOF02_1622 [Blastocatellia bacterium]|jgi:uncharacterized coiled-coil DUF342 family protein|nr:hypothetical protein [Blastocatellia bacterium]